MVFISIFLHLAGTIGEAGCVADNHCTGDAMCIDNVCQCPTNFHPTPDNSRCARVGGEQSILAIFFSHTPPHTLSAECITFVQLEIYCLQY